MREKSRSRVALGELPMQACPGLFPLAAKSMKGKNNDDI